MKLNTAHLDDDGLVFAEETLTLFPIFLEDITHLEERLHRADA
jgi:hypothetical protein